MAYESGGETYDGTVEGSDEDFGVCVEGVGDVEVVGGEVLEVEAELVFFCAGGFACYGDVCSSVVGEEFVRRCVYISAGEDFERTRRRNVLFRRGL